MAVHQKGKKYQVQVNDMGKMYVNIFHRLDGDGERFEVVKWQQELAHRCGIRTTLFMSYTSLKNPYMVEYAKTQALLGDEIGITFNDFQSSEMSELCGTKEEMIYLASHQAREIIIRTIFERFYKEFGFYPKSVASYLMDAPLIDAITKAYPTVTGCVNNCFEEGVNMFNGNNYCWNLFSDGGPWGAYYPSKNNALKPAADDEEALGVVALPHLNRDMILALTSRDDYFASHAPNVIRAKANAGNHSPYMLRFIDQWIVQAELNGYSYFNMFVSSPWLAANNEYVEVQSEAFDLYEESIEHLARRSEEGKVAFCTMSEFTEWYRGSVKVGTPEINLWNDILCGTKRQMLWYCDPYFRGTFDMNVGGELRDLRPYAGKVKRDIGPDGNALWNGSYPFLLSYEHRTWTFYTCFIHKNGERVSVSDRRTSCKVFKNEEGRYGAEIKSVKLTCGGHSITVASRLEFMGGGMIKVTRRLEDAPEEEVFEFEEQIRGCWGSTEYPEDMRSIRLSCGGETHSESIPYEYKTRTVEKNGHFVRAEIGELNTVFGLYSDEPLICGFEEGSIANSYYTLWLKKELKKGEAIVSWLKIEKKC